MLRRFGLFLVGVLIVVAIGYVARLAIGLIGLPGGFEHLCDVVIALLCLIGIVYLAYCAIMDKFPPIF